MPFRTRAFLHVSYCTLSVTFCSLLETKALDCQTILTVPLFVLLIKYAHIRAIVTRLACCFIACVSVHSPFSLFSCGGSHLQTSAEHFCILQERFLLPTHLVVYPEFLVFQDSRQKLQMSHLYFLRGLMYTDLYKNFQYMICPFPHTEFLHPFIGFL